MSPDSQKHHSGARARGCLLLSWKISRQSLHKRVHCQTTMAQSRWQTVQC